VVTGEGGLEFDFAGRARGRGAYVHARPLCLDKAPRGLARALRVGVGSSGAASDLRARLVVACNRRMAALLSTARRIKAVRAGEPGSGRGAGSLAGPGPVMIVAVDAGSVASSPAVQAWVAGGRALAWGTRSDLGALLGAESIATCAVEHASIGAELLRTRAAADAASAVSTETMQSSRRPEAR
jgi:hypothetical protein